MVRWDAPLFTVLWSDEHIPGPDILDAITKGNLKPPNSGTLSVAKAPTDALHVLEQTTATVVSAIVSASSSQPTGGTVIVPVGPTINPSITLPPRTITLSEMQRLKRQFVTIHKKAITLGTTERGAVDWQEDSVAAKFVAATHFQPLSVSSTTTMPLPTDTTLSLLAYPRPDFSKPKKAMLVRLSTETLEALESLPPVQFEFGDSPGIYIGDAYFPMNHLEEKSATELYLRSSSGAKKTTTTPLKLHANVIGKFAVERELADVRERIRESTQVATDQRNRPTTKFIDAPPDTLPPPPKKKNPSSTTLFRNPPRPADRPKPAPPPPTATPNNRPSSSTPTQRDGLVPLRKRLVHCLAISEKLEDQLLKLLGASDRSSALRTEIFELLNELADIKKGTAHCHRVYQLKPIGWKEVRPHEWPRLTDQERLQMARSARIAMNSLRIPESDPIWSHFRTSPPATSSNSPYPAASSSSASTSKQDVPAPKRGVSSREVKEKKQKPKADPKAEIMMKDESVRASNRDPPPAVRINDSSRPAPEPIRRNQPSAAKPIKINPRPSAASSSSTTKTSREERPVAPSVASSKSSQQDDKKLSTQARKIRREELAQFSDSDRERSSTQGDRRRPKRKEMEYAEPKAPAPKRKTIDYDDDEYDDRSSRQKKRKTDPQVHASSASREDRVKDVPRKSMVDPRPSDRGAERERVASSSSAPKKKKLSPPPPPAIPAKRVSSSNGRAYSEVSNSSKYTNTSTSGTKTTATKRKRVSPVYTSSEDEKEDEVPLSKRVTTKSAPPPPPAVSSAPSYSYRPRPLPTDHASLRVRYDDSYIDYLQSLRDLNRQKLKLKNLLKNNDIARAGSITDSDGDVELLGPEELERLTTKHRRLHEELQTIQQIFSGAVKSEPSSD
ncbi:hypothetical protein NLJ89_g8958 [Agrocybe chaxingu]|uniref:RNA polymerase II elongation factor ELL N-terminal domain-containing protein n=1 Tax=Agrocybe chaxingu TaxID=84603 RepID=A0A9W8JTE4_9AGAR|nr:hypothetical protein NLJ89_g8958 [Agrocybe chaxingu]